MKLRQAVVVEGRYDRVKLDSAVDAAVITTDGFNIFKDKDKQRLIKTLADGDGIIVLTDSDFAGFKIRKFISDVATGGRVYHAYIPEIEGKEKRKSSPGKAGLLGVEGVDVDTLALAIERCLAEAGEETAEPDDPEKKRITAADLFEDGLNGRAGASERRRKLLAGLGLPSRLSTNTTLRLLNQLCGYDGYKELVGKLGET